MAGVSVSYATSPDDEACSSSAEVVQTDSEGRFSFSGTRGFLYWIPLAPAHYGHSFRLCLRSPKSEEVSWVGRYLAGPSASTLVAVTCVLGQSDEACRFEFIEH